MLGGWIVADDLRRYVVRVYIGGAKEIQGECLVFEVPKSGGTATPLDDANDANGFPARKGNDEAAERLRSR